MYNIYSSRTVKLLACSHVHVIVNEFRNKCMKIIINYWYNVLKINKGNTNIIIIFLSHDAQKPNT